MRLALTDLFQARWTDLIPDEGTRNVLTNRPDITPESLARCRRLMDEHIPDCLVTGYQKLIPTLSLADPDDRHVLAAAIHSGASFIVTFNLGEFPKSSLEPYHIGAIHPDEFAVRRWDEHPAAVLEAVKLQRAGLRKPPKTAAEYLATIEQCQLPETAGRLWPYIAQI
jgi:hypothetical protein